ncbi:MAG: hypothetical protein JO122_12530, partial [Acetobacteraceae bacterium]|nr:hypothetical protein [Acetobacteraceae bacterium]
MNNKLTGTASTDRSAADDLTAPSADEDLKALKAAVQASRRASYAASSCSAPLVGEIFKTWPRARIIGVEGERPDPPSPELIEQ